MATSKLLKKLFRYRSKKTNGAAEAAAPAASTSDSALLSSSPQQLSRNLEPHPQSASLFFLLPGELRNKIYFFAIYPSLSAITIYQNSNTVFSPKIFQICRRMRSEAISQMCSSKIFYLSGLRTSNEFFEIVRDGLPSLQHVTIRSPSAWRSKSDKMEVERRELLDFLELATGLKRLILVVGACPLDPPDEANIDDPASVGTRFLHAVRDVVDGEVCAMQEERATRERFLVLCEQVGAMQAVQLMRETLYKEHAGRQERVFRLCKVKSMEYGYENVGLPLQMPKYLQKTESNSGRKDAAR